MLRASLFVVAVSTSACAIDPDTDQAVLCFDHCGDLGTDPAPVPPQTFTFHVDQGASFAPRLAVGGVIEVDVEALPLQVPQVTATGNAFTLAVTSAEPHLTRTQVTGVAPGEGTISATVPHVDRPGEFGLGVGELATIEAAVDGDARESLVVLTDIREVTLHLTATDGGGLLMDHTLAIDATSDPGFTQPRWDAIGVPATPGDYVLALTRKAGDLHHVGVRVIDRVDAIVGDGFAPGESGTLCVHAEAGGEPVATRAWVFRGTSVVLGAPQGACVSWYQADPGATIGVELAGTAASFALRP